MTRWFSADLHFGHANIIKYCDRPWSTVEEMNAGIVERWNSVVAPDDEAWVLGDVALSVRNVQEWVPQLNGILRLIAGNHDHCWVGHKKYAKSVAAYHDAGFKGVQTSGVIRSFKLSNGQSVTLSHLPYQGDSHDSDRYEAHRPKDNGEVNICGHVHEKWTTQGRSVNVGIDRHDWYPVQEDRLIEIISTL